MLIEFRSELLYAVKVLTGGVNAVSGEPSVETAASLLRQRQRLSSGKSLQDYVVLPKQPWIDGIASTVGKVRQFVAMPMGSGYSVERQITGSEETGGMQIEITPVEVTPLAVTVIDDHVTTNITIFSHYRVSDIERLLNLSVEEYLIAPAGPMIIDKPLSETKITDGCTISVVRYPKKSLGFEDRERSISLTICNLDNAHDVSNLNISLADTVDDIKFLLSQRVKTHAHHVDLFLPAAKPGRPGSPLHGRKTASTALPFAEEQRMVFAKFQHTQANELHLFVHVLARKQIPFSYLPGDRIMKLLSDIQRLLGLLTDRYRVSYAHIRLSPSDTFEMLDMKNDDVFEVLEEQCGGGPPVTARTIPAGIEMGIAAGGLIKQTIAADSGKRKFNAALTKTFNVQILNSMHYTEVTGKQPPEPVVDVRTYAEHGYPCFEIYEEPSTVCGQFDGVKSIKQLDDAENAVVEPGVVCIGSSVGEGKQRKRKHSDSFVVQATPGRFRSIEEIEQAVQEKGQPGAFHKRR